MTLHNEVYILFQGSISVADHVALGWIQKDVLPERLYTAPVHKGDVMATHSIARVLVLKDNTSHGFKVNDLVYCLTAGWRRYAVVKTDPSSCLPVMYASAFSWCYAADLTRVPENVSPTAALGLFGVPGFTAYCNCHQCAVSSFV